MLRQEAIGSFSTRCRVLLGERGAWCLAGRQPQKRNWSERWWAAVSDTQFYCANRCDNLVSATAGASGSRLLKKPAAGTFSMGNVLWRYLVATTGLGFSDWTPAVLDLYRRLHPPSAHGPSFAVVCPLKDGASSAEPAWWSSVRAAAWRLFERAVGGHPKQEKSRENCINHVLEINNPCRIFQAQLRLRQPVRLGLRLHMAPLALAGSTASTRGVPIATSG